jgi:VCBS repeat-containing protein
MIRHSLSASGRTGLAAAQRLIIQSDAAGGYAAARAVSGPGSDNLPVAQPDGFTIAESGTIVGGDLFADNGSGADSDPGGPPLSISAVNGSAGNLNTTIALASGALLTVNSNGTFNYDPNGAFLATPAPGSGASNTPGHDSFTYTLTGGNTVTVSIALTGLDSDDVLRGTAGADMLAGGTGNDTYFVENSADQVSEATGQGFDAVYTSVNYTLAAGSEVEWLSAAAVYGTNALNLTGNELANSILGNQGINVLNGAGGADVLVGYGGNDTYYVDNASDAIFEAAGAGSDAVYASTSYALFAGVSVEWLSAATNYGTEAINLTGNELGQALYGNQGNNIFVGGGGADAFIGYGGDDIYFVDSQSDTIYETVNGGYDAIYTSVSYSLVSTFTLPFYVEWLSTDAVYGTAPINLTGNGFNNVILGNDGNNILNGAFGTDIIYGFGGADTFYFSDVAPYNPNVPGGTTFIVDFTVGTDKIGFNKDIFNLGAGPGPLPASAFVNGTAAGDADDRLIYNPATGELYYDNDGSGSYPQVLFAILTNHAAISAADIQII